MKPTISREVATVLITLALLALPLVAVATYVYQKHQWAQARLAELEPRYARLQGLEQQRTDLEATLARAKAARTQ